MSTVEVRDGGIVLPRDWRGLEVLTHYLQIPKTMIKIRTGMFCSFRWGAMPGHTICMINKQLCAGCRMCVTGHPAMGVLVSHIGPAECLGALRPGCSQMLCSCFFCFF